MTRFSPSRMLSFDLETTSLDRHEARIVTSALVTIDESGAHPRELLADPGVEIPKAARDVHGISTEYAREHGRPHDEVLAETIDAIRAGWEEGYTLIVFNAPYDLSVLAALEPGFTVDGPVLDPLLIDRLNDRYRKGKRNLSVLSEHYGVSLDNAHEATADALAAARIAWKQARFYPAITEKDADELMEYQAVGYYELQADFRSYLERKGRDASDVDTAWPMLS